MVLHEILLHHVRAGVQDGPQGTDHVTQESVGVRRLLSGLAVSFHVGDDNECEAGKAQGYAGEVFPVVLRAQPQARDQHHRYRAAAAAPGRDQKGDAAGQAGRGEGRRRQNER